MPGGAVLANPPLPKRLLPLVVAGLLKKFPLVAAHTDTRSQVRHAIPSANMPPES